MTALVNPRLLVDADVLIKLSVLDCFLECIRVLGYALGDCATLKSMTFSAGLNNRAVRERKAGVGAPGQRLLKTLQTVPTLDILSGTERALSAQIGQVSQRCGLSIDGGEALLVSICIERGLPYLTTGDKKAIRSLPALSRQLPITSKLRGRLMPLEYLLLRLIRKEGLPPLYSRLVAGMSCDATVRNILLAAGQSQSLFEAGLESKLGSLRQDAPGFIAS